jgi:cysteinyl-tRNA synthetase
LHIFFSVFPDVFNNFDGILPTTPKDNYLKKPNPKAYEKYLDLEPNCEVGWFNRGIVLEHLKQFEKAMDDDLNTPKAIQVLHSVLDDFDFDAKKKLKLLEKFDEVLGLGIKDMKETLVIASPEIEKLMKAREEARKKKMWAEADILRERIKEKGYLVKDTSQGPKLEKV